MSSILQTLVGYTVLGDIFSGNGSTILNVLKGDHDDIIRLAFFHTLYNRHAENVNEALTDSMVNDRLNAVKTTVRSRMSRDIQAIENYHKHQNKQKIVKAFLESNKPSEHGTVNEIAAKYGWSKSDVRRFKKDGILDQKIAEKN